MSPIPIGHCPKIEDGLRRFSKNGGRGPILTFLSSSMDTTFLLKIIEASEKDPSRPGQAFLSICIGD